MGAPDLAPTLAADRRYALRFANADNLAAKQYWRSSLGRFMTGLTVTVTP